MADFDPVRAVHVFLVVGFAVASIGVVALAAAVIEHHVEPAPVEPTPVDACGPEWHTVPTPLAAAPGTVCCVYTDQHRHYARNIDSWIGPVCFPGGSDVRVE